MTATESLQEFIPLYDSRICRLCGEKNDNGYTLYGTSDEDKELCTKINTYLPLFISDDGKFPRWICPGCHLQVEATVEFFTLILRGQKILRELYKRQSSGREYNNESEIENIYESPSSNYECSETNAIQEGLFTSDDGELIQNTLPAQKRKRGRPPKSVQIQQPPDKEYNPVQEISYIEEDRTKEIEKEAINGNTEILGGRQKRQIKAPVRYQEVQGKELEKVYADMGLIEKTYIGDANDNIWNGNKELHSIIQDDVIGHVQDGDGVNLGDLIVINQERKKRNKKIKRIQKKTRLMCDICKVCFWHEQKFLQHRFSHRNVLYECTHCLETFKDRNSLTEHQLSKSHTGEGIIEDFENLFGENLNTLKLNNSSTSSNNDHSNEVFVSSKELLHNFEALNKNQQVPYESQSINALDEVFNNIDEIAGELLTDSQNMKNLQLVPPQITNEQEILTNVNLTNSKLSNTVQMEEKQQSGNKCEINKDISSCKDEDDDDDDDDDISELLDAMKYTCKQCGKVFNEFETYIEHKNEEHITGRRYICSKCRKCFKSKQLLQRHQLVHSELRPHSCDKCGAAFKTKNSLVSHELIHNENKKYHCKICNQKFVYKHSLKLHLRLHNGSKPFTCPHCKKSFTQLGNMQEHLRVHTGERPYQCIICPKRFKTSSQCRMHIKRHEHNRPLHCSRCDKSFVNNDDLRTHERRHDNFKPFSCDKCGKCFIDISSLKKHLRLHTGEKPFTCCECDRKFADRSNLNKHLKLHNASIKRNRRTIIKEEPLNDVVENSDNIEIKPTIDTDEEFIKNISDANILNAPNFIVNTGGDNIIVSTDTLNFTTLPTTSLATIPQTTTGTFSNFIEDATSMINPNEFDLKMPQSGDPNEFDLKMPQSGDPNEFDLKMPQSGDLLSGNNTKQVVYVTYQDPNNPIGNKTTLYVMQ